MLVDKVEIWEGFALSSDEPLQEDTVLRQAERQILQQKSLEVIIHSIFNKLRAYAKSNESTMSIPTSVPYTFPKD